MPIRTNIQIDEKDYAIIKEIYKDLKYKSISEYFRSAITARIREDQRRIRDMKRAEAMKAIGRHTHEHAFESIEGEDFENR